MPVIEILAVIAIMAIAYAAYRRMMVSANYTAAHELGHAYACRYYGVPVHHVKLNEFGTGGYTTFDIPSSIKHHMVIIAAGYVAEEQARGRVVTSALRGGQYEGDMHIMHALEGYTSEAEAIAISRAIDILSREDIAAKMRDLVPVLAGEGEISGSRIL